MTPGQRNTTEQLRTLLNAYHQQPNAGMPQGELGLIDAKCDTVIAFTGEDTSHDARAWHRAAVATKQLLRDHSEHVRSRMDSGLRRTATNGTAVSAVGSDGSPKTFLTLARTFVCSNTQPEVTEVSNEHSSIEYTFEPWDHPEVTESVSWPYSKEFARK